MRHKYVTRALILQRTPIKESASLVTLLTSDLGLIRAKAEGLRKPGAKLASALQTLSEADVTLVRGKDGWRLSGALPVEAWFGVLDRTARLRAGRVASLVLRLVHGEVSDPALFTVYAGFLSSLAGSSEDAQDASECLVALSILQTLGLDAGPMHPVSVGGTLSPADRHAIVMRINRGIVASGL